jgi:RimJ/RimL family protein N-acetyltransferase
MSNSLGPFGLESSDFAGIFSGLAHEERSPVAAKDAFPETEIATDRLLLRAYTEADIEDHAAMFDHEIMRLWTNAPHPYTREHSRAWCTQMADGIRTSGDGICWAVTDRFSGRFLGCTGFYRTDWCNKVTEVTASGAPWAVGHGYAKEALRAISRWALLEQRFNRLQIRTAIANPAPQRVARACGFVREGILRNAGSLRSGQVDMAMYSLIPGDIEAGGVQRGNGGRDVRHLVTSE